MKRVSLFVLLLSAVLSANAALAEEPGPTVGIIDETPEGQGDVKPGWHPRLNLSANFASPTPRTSRAPPTG